MAGAKRIKTKFIQFVKKLKGDCVELMFYRGDNIERIIIMYNILNNYQQIIGDYNIIIPEYSLTRGDKIIRFKIKLTDLNDEDKFFDIMKKWCTRKNIKVKYNCVKETFLYINIKL